MISIEFSRVLGEKVEKQIKLEVPAEVPRELWHVLYWFVEEICPELRLYIFDSHKKTRKLVKYINFYINGINIKTLKGKAYSEVKVGDTISIVPTIAGG